MQVTLVNTLAHLREINTRVRKAGAFSFDTESTGLHPVKDRITMHVITLPDESTYIIPVRMCVVPNVDRRQVKRFIGPLLKSKSIRKTLWNAKIDKHFLCNDGMKLNNYYDAMVAGWMLDENTPKSLKVRAKDVGIDDHSKFSWAKYFTLRKKFEDGSLTPKGLGDLTQYEEDMVEYAAKDGVATQRLGILYRSLLDKEPVLNNALTKVWMPGIEMLFDMERTGMCVDINRMRRARIACRKMIVAAETRLYKEAGKVINVNSPQQLAQLLYEDMGLPVLAVTKKGAPATGHDVLAILGMESANGQAYGTPGFVPKYPIVQHILDVRKYSKLYGTYLGRDSSMASRIHKGRLHTSYNIAGTGTGRLSSSDPNLQNIPQVNQERKELSIRHCIVPPRNHKLLIADFSQFELRVITDVTQDKEMLDVYLHNGDIHTKTEEGLGVTRRPAKNLNFGAFYDVQAPKFSTMLTVSSGEYYSVEKCEQLLEGMFQLYSGVPVYKERLYRKMRAKEYVTTYLGRRRRLPDINAREEWKQRRAQRQGFNAKIQGSVADIMNLCMLRAFNDSFLQKHKIKMVGQVHDEVHFAVPDKVTRQFSEELLVKHLKSIFEHPFVKPLSIPIVFNCEPLAASWGEAK